MTCDFIFGRRPFPRRLFPGLGEGKLANPLDGRTMKVGSGPVLLRFSGNFARNLAAIILEVVINVVDHVPHQPRIT